MAIRITKKIKSENEFCACEFTRPILYGLNFETPTCMICSKELKPITIKVKKLKGKGIKKEVSIVRLA